MRGSLSETSWPYDARDGDDLEERVAGWFERHDSAPDIWSAVLIAGSFFSMVLFAVIR
jgi:hypothetical protein